MADRTVSVKLIADARAYIQGMDEAARKTREASQTIEQKLEAQKEAFERVGQASMVAGGLIVGGLALATKAAIDWESSWAGVMKTVNASPAEFGALEQSLRDMAGVLPATHDEIAAVAEAAGQLGIAVENIPEFTRVMVDMGEATNLSSDEAATSLARFMNVMGTAQSEVGNLGSAVVALGNSYATTEAEIVQMSQRLSGAGVQVGLSEGEVLGLATALSSVGIEAEAGGSAISKVMIDIAASVEDGGDRLAQFADVAGVSAEQFAEQWRTAPGEALASFVAGLANAESQGQSTLGILADLEITEVRMRDALLRSAAASDSFTAAMVSGNEAYEEGTALAAEAEQRYATAGAQLEILRNKIVDAGISFGEVLLPALTAAVGGIGGFVDMLADMPEPLKVVTVVAAALTGGVLLLGGAALVAVPQIVAFRTSLQTLGITAAATRGMIAGAGASLATLGAALAPAGIVAAGMFALAGWLESTRPQAEEWAAAIRDGASATDMLTLANQGFLNSIDGAEFDPSNIRDYVDQMQRIDESNGWASLLPENWDVQFTDFASRMRQIDEQLSSLSADEAAAALDVLRESEDFAALSAEDLNFLLPQTRDVVGDLGEASAAAAEGVEEIASASEVAAEAASELYGEAKALNDLFFNAQDAMAGYEQTIDDIAEAMADGLAPALLDGGEGFDLAEQSGRDAAAMLQELVQNAQLATETMSGNGATAEELADQQASAAEQIYNAGIAMGLSEDAARSYADRLVAIPSEVSTAVALETAAANAALTAFVTQRRVIQVAVDVAGMPSGTIVRPGQMGQYAAGGRIPGYAPGYDDRLGFLSNGSVVGLGGGEYIMPTRMTDKYLHILEQMRQGTFVGYASGGRVGQPQQSNTYRPVINVSAPSGGGGVQISQVVQPAPGMSEQAFADRSAAAMSWELRRA